MVGKPEIDILDGKMLELLCWNLMCFLCFSVLQYNIYIYIIEELLGNILLLRENAGKTFTESCNNPVLFKVLLE